MGPLAHPAARAVLAADRTAALERALAACALGVGSLSEGTRKQLDAAVDSAARVLESAPFDPGRPGGDPLERRSPEPEQRVRPFAVPGAKAPDPHAA
ncbi:MAG: hypothetical protein LBV78_18490 [Kitasatospora sp.]|nr:hypothetical protein [Kitasatospora sp.]